MITILLIEDDKADQQIFRRYLKQTGYEAHLIVAGSIKEAKDSVRDIQIDLAFCDYNLPDGNALEFLSQTKDWENFPVVVITSQGDVERATESLKMGAFDFITKDNIIPPGLIRTIQNAERYKNEHLLRRNLEVELQKSYTNTTAILDNTTNNIWSLDLDGRMLLLNERAAKNFEFHLGVAPQIGELLFPQIPEEYRGLWQMLFEKAKIGEHVGSVDEYQLANKQFYFELECNPIRDGEDITGVIFFLTDVTERKGAENLIRESEKNFRSVFEGSDMAIIVEELENNTIIDLNKAAADLHNYTREEMVGMSIFDTIPPDYLEKSKANYQLHLKGQLTNLDSYVYTSDKKSIPISIELNKINYNGVVCNLLLMQDISIRKETENKLAEAKELAEQTAAFRSSFLANMSHEIRTPMNAMIGFTDLLVATDLTGEQNEYVDIIRRSGDDLMVIINDILDISKIQAGKMEIRTEHVDLVALLDNVLRLHKYKAESKGITININFGSSLPEVILADPTRLAQILNNLVSNALKFTEEGGVTLEVNQASETSEEILLHFKVEDTGIGIPEDKLSEVFSEFSQIDSSLQRSQAGTGLGLSIVYQMTSLMNGKCWAESTLGQGTSFHLKIPFRKQASEEEIDNKKAHVLEWGDLEGIKLLIVEDNEVNTLLAKRTLSKVNFELEFAENGRVAVEKALSFQPDVIFMDVQMPIMNGYEAAKKIREFSSVPILAMTAHVLDEEKQRCEAAGMNGFIPKPFKQADILNALAGVGEGFLNSPDPLSNDPIASLGMPSLTELAEGDVSFASKLLDSFINAGSTELTALREANQSGDLEKIKYLAHKLRSSLVLFDFNDLVELSIRLESEPITDKRLEKFVLGLEDKIKFAQEARSKLG